MSFVDEPRRAVEQADNLVAVTMKRQAEMFAAERAKLEGQWDHGDNVSTEDLRLGRTTAVSSPPPSSFLKVSRPISHQREAQCLGRQRRCVRQKAPIRCETVIPAEINLPPKSSWRFSEFELLVKMRPPDAYFLTLPAALSTLRRLL